MDISNQLIADPSICLFAFQQQQEFFSKGSVKILSPEWSTHKYRQILNHFHVCQKIKLDSRLDNDSLVNPTKDSPQSISQTQGFLGTIKTQENLELIQGEAYPGCIDTSQIISFRINKLKQNAEETISIDKLASFNPKNCFSPENINTNLGQTVILTALVNSRKNTQPESLQSLADSCLSSFTHLPSSSQKTVLIDSSIISNGCIFTYYLAENSHQYNQVIVCLFFRQEDRDNFHQHHQQLSKFFLWFHKLTYVHQYSSSLLNLACYQIGQLKYHLKTSSSNHLTQVPSLKDFETKYTSVSSYNKIDRSWQKNNLSKKNEKQVAVFSNAS